MDVREKLEVIAHLGDHISYKEDIGICYDSALAEVIEDAYMTLKNGVMVQDNTEITDELLKRLRNAPVTVMTEEPTIEAVQEWISVKDRLPEESGMYIVTANDGHAQRVSFVLWQKRNKAWNLTGARSYWRVTHWCYLPQPPKGE